MFRRILPLTLLAGSLVFAALIFFAKTPGTTAPLAEVLNTNEPLPTQNAPVTPDPVTQATIQNIASGIAKEIVDSNPDGPVNSDTQTQFTATNPDAIAQKLLESGITIDYSKFNPQIKPSDLHIIPGADKNLAENYLKNAVAIENRNFSGVAPDFANLSVADLQKLIAAYNQTLKELYSLNVPASLADIHTEKLRLFTFQKNLFENIVDYAGNQNDLSAAFMARLSLRMFDKAYTDLSALDEQIANFARQNNLQI